MERFTCSLCGCTERNLCFSAYDFDSSTKPFELEECSSCGLAVTEPVPDPSELDMYYTEDYYGSDNKKFSGVVEFLTVQSCKNRAKKILNEIS